ncbi:hypothetical protein ACIA8G_15755 [Lentzea sp. NPDC051213]|uniref:hypothetical protein n=1 Tax=Lentzea sp. NPDC051213 TaxID=3364126 RepID=UPI0037AC2B78
MKLVVVVLVLFVVSCGQSDSRVSSPDCRKVASIASSGKPVATLSFDLLLPGEVTEASASVLPAGSGVEVPPGESTLAMPDPDVDRIVAAGKVSSLPGLRASVEKMIGERGWRVGSNSSASDGRFSLEYQGPGVSGSVVALNCDEPRYLVTAEVSPLLPSDTTPFSCDRLRPAFAGIRPGDLPGSCTWSEGGTRLQVTFARPPLDPFQWRPRLQELRRNARDYTSMYCGHTTAAAGFAAQCTAQDAFGARAAVSAVRDNDFWAGAQVELKNEGATTDQARTMAETAVRTLTG